MNEQSPTRSPSLQTLCISGGHRPSPENTAVSGSIVQSSTFLVGDDVYEKVAAGRDDEVLIYTRYGNPTLSAVQKRLASLEGAEECLVFSSGMAAMNAALLANLERGAHILAARQLYGGNWDLICDGLAQMGFEVTLFDVEDLDACAAALRPETSVVLVESLSNPLMTVADLPRIAEIARNGDARLVVDATFVSPVVQRPLELGAHLVMHSASKFLGGHSDLIGGVVCGSREEMLRVRPWLKRAGGCMDPHAAYMLDRGLKTLYLRVRTQCATATRLAAFLNEHERVERVLHPSLATHSSHAIAERLLEQPGAMLSLVLKDGDDAALEVVHALNLALEAPSLGGVETLVGLPRYMSHAHLSPAERQACGILPGTVRVSVGIEDPLDLIADFRQALG